MLKANDLSKQIAAYGQGSIALDQFEDWFRDESRGAYLDAPLWDLCTSVEAILSGYSPRYSTEDALRQELAAAIRPFDDAAVAQSLIARKPLGKDLRFLFGQQGRSIDLASQTKPTRVGFRDEKVFHLSGRSEAAA
jgi:hypothetical protein